MAQIKIIGNINDIIRINRYKDIDVRLVKSLNIKSDFGKKDDFIEFYISDVGGNLLASKYNYKDFKSAVNAGLSDDGSIQYIEIDPVKDIQSSGYSNGAFSSQYNFFRTRISNLFLKEISSDRTEIRVSSIALDNNTLLSIGTELVNEITNSAFYKDYLLNFGNNIQVVSVNVAIQKDANNVDILFKLYEPLPYEINLKSQFSVVEEIIEPYVFQIDLDKLIIPDPLPVLRGPNFDIEIENKNTTSTQYQSYDDIISSYSSTSSSSYYQVLSFTTSQSIDINVDYTDFNNFNKFGSVQKRIQNFFSKVQNIEENNTFIVNNTPNITTTSSLASEIAAASSSISSIISNFDGYEYFLYYESSSLTYPKSVSSKPFLLYPSTSSQAQTWMTSSLTSASLFDESNLDNLEHVIPQFVQEDDNNQPYINFVNMIGHYFDNIWIYLKSLTDINKNDNNLNEGVSKDLVYYALKNMGVKLYNSKGDEHLTDYIVGSNSGSVTDYVNLSNEFLNNIPKQDLLAETFKRIYHNIPLLFKSKGTITGIDAFNNIFGITGSILPIREFGGVTKDSYLQGYNNDKIRIIDNNLSGSVLSSLISTQENQIESRSIDLHRLDISFSPQNQIDLRISQSISSSYPNFNIDNIIGDPRLAYSSSYPNLVVTASNAFKSTFSHQFDYSGFVRLIKFFDNTLFKTIKDYTPARTSTTTGVVIRSPQVERIKIKQAETNADLNNILDAEYESPEISEDHSYHYQSMINDKKAFYSGNITGSNINVYSYFERLENTWLHSFQTSSFNFHSGSQTTSSIVKFSDRNYFEHTDFNVLLNNVTGSRKSLNRIKIDKTVDYVSYKYIALSQVENYILPTGWVYNGNVVYLDKYGNIESINLPEGVGLLDTQGFISYDTGSLLFTSLGNRYIDILTTSELQDSYSTLETYNNSRYDGSKVTSTLYNDYTLGDKSFGKTAAIDHQVTKVGLYSEITENIYLPNRNNVVLKYLVDKNGAFTELNQRNIHWEDVQRTFVASENGAISLFDNQRYSNQKGTDGIKNIFDSGYSYYPMLYFTDIDPILYFRYTGINAARLFKAKNERSNKTIFGPDVNPGYPATSGIIYGIFETDNNQSLDTFDDSNLYIPGDATSLTLPKYTVPEAGNYIFSANLSINVTFDISNNSGSFTLDILRNSNTIKTQTLNFVGNNTLNVSNPDKWIYFSNPNWSTVHQISTTTQTTTVDLLYADVNGVNHILPAGSTIYVSTGAYHYPSCTESGLSNTATIITLVDPNSNYIEGHMPCVQPNGTYINMYYRQFDISKYNIYSSVYGNSLSSTQTFDLVTDFDSFAKSDVVEFKLTQGTFSTSNYTSSIATEGLLKVELQSNFNNVDPYAITGSVIGQFVSGAIAPDEIVLNSSLSGFIGYSFLPNTGSISSSLYSAYGDINYTFDPSSGDILFLDYHGSTMEYRIMGYNVVNNEMHIKISPNYPSTYLNVFAPSDITRVLFLKRIDDENNTIVRFNKQPGKTSYGLLIPENIHPGVLENIDEITNQIKQKIVELGGIL